MAKTVKMWGLLGGQEEVRLKLSQRVADLSPEFKPPETWLTRRRKYMTKRYGHLPFGGFSGAMSVAAVQKKKLLGA